MDALGLSDFVLGAQARTQSNFQTEVNRLSSGLRITSAADDPSGLAISETLASKVAGLDQGAQEIQTATNALTVAEGAMQTIADILQRMRTILVESRSGLMSAGDETDLQAELNQLTLEINRIAANTQFNGRNLLDGSASSQQPLGPRALLVQNDQLTGGGTLIDTVVNPPNVIAGSPQLVQTVTVDSYDPTTGDVNVHVVIGSQNPSFGPDQVNDIPVATGTNYPVGSPPPTPGNPDWVQQDQNGNNVLAFDVGTLSAQDVGKSATLVTLDPESKVSGAALQINTGDAEGAVLSVDIPAMTAVNLGVNDVQLGNDLENMGAEYRIDYGISHLANVRAQIGAQLVSLQDAANNNNIASVNTQASESAIRDLNVGQEVTTFTRDQIISQFQSKLLANTEQMAQSVATLVSASIVGA